MLDALARRPGTVLPVFCLARWRRSTVWVSEVVSRGSRTLAWQGHGWQQGGGGKESVEGDTSGSCLSRALCGWWQPASWPPPKTAPLLFWAYGWMPDLLRSC